MIRPFAAGDIEAVSRLHRKVFAERDDLPEQTAREYDTYFRELFVDSPWKDPGLPSLVFEGKDGLIGFLGVVPIDVRFEGQVVRASRSTQLIVDPNKRAGLAGVQLLREYLNGDQELSIADEATHGTMRIWERLEGAAVALFSMRWARMLQPARSVLTKVGNRAGLGLAATVARPLAWGTDALARSLSGSPFRPPEPDGTLEPLTAQIVLDNLGAVCAGARLNPGYTVQSLEWVLRRAGVPSPTGQVERHAVMDAGSCVGWFVYCPFEGGHAAEVLQLMCLPGREQQVFDHLVLHASSQGFVELRGRMIPRLAEVITDAQGLFYRRGPWFLAHSRRPELIDPLFRGETTLSRLDGEWPLRFS